MELVIKFTHIKMFALAASPLKDNDSVTVEIRRITVIKKRIKTFHGKVTTLIILKL